MVRYGCLICVCMWTSFVQKFGDVDNSVIDTLVPSISIKYKTRQSAENVSSELIEFSLRL